MFTGMILLTVIALIAVISYRRPRLEEKVIKSIPIVDWINILIVPLLGYFGLVLIVRSILSRPSLEILDFDDIQILSIGIVFLVYTFVGNSIHFVAKVLSRYMKPIKHKEVYKINEMFHGKLSHYLTFVCVFVVLFFIGLLEINHPQWSSFDTFSLYFISLCGILLGVSATKAIFYTNDWYGGYSKPLFLLTVGLVTLLLAVMRNFHLKLVYYPINLFIIAFFLSIIFTFVLRRVLWVSKFAKHSRLKLLTRLLSG